MSRFVVAGVLVVALVGCGHGAPAPTPAGKPIAAAVLPKAKPEARVAFEDGVRLMAQGPERQADAQAQFTKATALDGKLFEAWHNLGITQARLGRDEDAVISLRRALALQPAARATALALGELLLRTGGADDAVAVYRPFVNAQPDDSTLRLLLAGALREAGNTTAALDEVRGVLSRNSRSARAFNALGLIHLKLGKLGLAETAFRRALELVEAKDAADSEGVAAEAWNNLGLVRLGRGHDQEAFAAFGRALEADPSYRQALLNQAVVYLDCGDYARAREKLEKAARLGAADPDIEVALGVAARGGKQLDEAEAHYRRALTMQPEHAQALYNLGVLFMDFREDKAQARENLQRYRKVASAHDPHQKEAQQRLKELK